MEDRVLKSVNAIATMLVEKRYKDIEELTGGRRLLAIEIEKAILDYGRTLTLPPTSRFSDDATFIELASADHHTWAVSVPLWTREEGQSDLELEMTVTVDQGNTIVEIDNILVP